MFLKAAIDFNNFVGVHNNIQVRILPSQELLRVGDNVELRCDVEGGDDTAHRQPQVRWEFRNGEFEDNVQMFGNLLKIRDVRNENGNLTHQ